MRILQVFYQYNNGGTEKVIDFINDIFTSENHSCLAWFCCEGKQPKCIKSVIGESVKLIEKQDLIIVHGGLLSSPDYFSEECFSGTPVVEILHRTNTPKYVRGYNYVAVSQMVKKCQDVDCTVIYNPILISEPKKDRNEQREIYDIPREAFVIGRHCRWSMEKNWQDFIFICDNILRKHHQTHILLQGAAGDGQISEQIIRQWAKTNDRIHLLSWQDAPPRNLTVYGYIFGNL